MKPWQASKSYFWETAPFFRLLLPLAVAIVCYDKTWLPDISIALLVALLFVSISFVAITNLTSATRNIHFVLRAISIQAALFLFGWLSCNLHDIRNKQQWFGNHLDAQAYDVEALTAPVERARTWKLPVAVKKAWNDSTVKLVEGTAFLYLYKSDTPPDIRAGDRLIVPSGWVPISNAGNPQEFDYARFCSRSNIHFQQFLNSGQVVVHHRAIAEPSLVATTHDYGMKALERYIGDTATLGLIQAMLLGDEVNFDNDLRQRYVDTGIIHVVAISGSHVMVFFWIIGMLFFWLKDQRHAYIKYLVAVPLVCFYVAVAGAPTSAVRAALMFSFLALGMALQKDKQPLNQLFATAFFMLLYEPMWLFSVGFQLSFGAVLSLILFYPPIRKLYTPGMWLPAKLWEVAAASIAAEIIIAPLIIFYFHLLPATFLVANLIAYLLMTGVLIGGLLIVVFASMPWIAGAVAAILTMVVTLFNEVMLWLQKMNPASFKYLFLSLPQLILVYLIVCLIAIGYRARQIRVLGIGIACVCLLLSTLIVQRIESLRQQHFVVYNTNRKAYGELILGNKHYPIINPDTAVQVSEYATKEWHVSKHAWQAAQTPAEAVYYVKGKRILTLNAPIIIDTNRKFPIDYLVIAYPVKQFEGLELQQTFGFEKMIIASNQKRYLAQRWRDSCAKYNIPAHFTMFDGAFLR